MSADLGAGVGGQWQEHEDRGERHQPDTDEGRKEVLGLQADAVSVSNGEMQDQCSEGDADAQGKLLHHA